jgi:hypothetical protein
VFVNVGQAQFVEASTAVRISSTVSTALPGDLDGDRDCDLFVVSGCCGGPCKIFRNQRPFVPGPPQSSNFAVDVRNREAAVPAGTTFKVPVTTLALGGFSGQIALTAVVSPPDAGVSASVDPLSVPAGGTAQLTLSVSSGASRTTFDVALRATSGSFGHASGTTFEVGEGPAIASAKFRENRLKIVGQAFGAAPRVLVNDVDRTALSRSASATRIKLVGTAAQLGLVPGDNTVRVLDDDGRRSVPFVLRR